MDVTQTIIAQNANFLCLNNLEFNLLYGQIGNKQLRRYGFVKNNKFGLKMHVFLWKKMQKNQFVIIFLDALNLWIPAAYFTMQQIKF